jgi:hypothetical protein
MKLLFVCLVLTLSLCALAQEPKKAPTLKSILLEQLRTTHNQKEWFVPANTAVEGLTRIVESQQPVNAPSTKKESSSSKSYSTAITRIDRIDELSKASPKSEEDRKLMRIEQKLRNDFDDFSFGFVDAIGLLGKKFDRFPFAIAAGVVDVAASIAKAPPTSTASSSNTTSPASMRSIFAIGWRISIKRTADDH